MWEHQVEMLDFFTEKMGGLLKMMTLTQFQLEVNPTVKSSVFFETCSMYCDFIALVDHGYQSITGWYGIFIFKMMYT